MSQLQYIGARYVPVWYQNTDDDSANWQSNVQYEPLTFVTTVNDHLYISKKEVPDTIGNPADNREYWLDMGIFTQPQVVALTERVKALEDEKADMITIAPIEDEDEIGANYAIGDEFYRNSVLYRVLRPISINTPFSSLTLNTDYKIADPITADIKALIDFSETNSRYTLTSLKKKNAIMIGDSWGVTQPGGINNWMGVLTPFFKNVYANAHGGYSFNKSGASYITLFDNLSIPAGTKIDCIIAIGGANGVNSGECTAFIDHVRSVYPNADIIIGANGPMYSKSTFWAREQMIIKEASIRRCIALDDFWLTTSKTPENNWTADNYHLIDYTTFVQNIVGYLCSGVYPHTFNIGGIYNPNFVSSALTNYLKDVSYFSISRVKNSVAIMLSIAKGTNYTAAANNITLTSGTVYDIFEFPKAMIIPFYDNTDSGATSHMYVLQSGDYADIILRIPNDTPYVRLSVRAKQSGTFAKGDVFPGGTVLYTQFSNVLFDFTSLHDFTRTNQLAFTTDWNVR